MTHYYNGIEVLQIRPDGLCAGCAHVKESHGGRLFKAKWMITCDDLVGTVHYCGYCRNRLYWIVHEHGYDGELYSKYDYSEMLLS
jgi:hypothetical protein